MNAPTKIADLGALCDAAIAADALARASERTDDWVRHDANAIDAAENFRAALASLGLDKARLNAAAERGIL